jgi:hypothetical protein
MGLFAVDGPGKADAPVIRVEHWFSHRFFS